MKKGILYTIVIAVFSLALSGCTDQIELVLVKLQQSAGPQASADPAELSASASPARQAEATPGIAQEWSSDEELIIEALCLKNDWRPDDIIVTVQKNTGMFASGGVRETASEVGGGYWFAAKRGAAWEIVADGNGTIMCSSLAVYPDFPADMIPECYNEETGEMITR